MPPTSGLVLLSVNRMRLVHRIKASHVLSLVQQGPRSPWYVDWIESGQCVWPPYATVGELKAARDTRARALLISSSPAPATPFGQTTSSATPGAPLRPPLSILASPAPSTSPSTA